MRGKACDLIFKSNQKMQIFRIVRRCNLFNRIPISISQKQESLPKNLLCRRYGDFSHEWPRPIDPKILRILEDQRLLTRQSKENIFDSWCAEIDELENAFTILPFPDGQNNPKICLVLC